MRMLMIGAMLLLPSVCSGQVRIRVPFVDVDVGSGVHVRAPFTNVDVGPGVHVRAPFTDVYVPPAGHYHGSFHDPNGYYPDTYHVDRRHWWWRPRHRHYWRR